MTEARGALLGHRLHHNRPSIQPSVDRNESQGTRKYAINRPLYTKQVSRQITHTHTRKRTFLSEGDRVRRHCHASTPHTPIASQSYQRTPTQPSPYALGGRPGTRSPAGPRRRRRSTNGKLSSRPPRCWPNRQEGPVSSCRTSAATTTPGPTAGLWAQRQRPRPTSRRRRTATVAKSTR